MATKKKILYIVEAMGGGVFTYIVDLANELVDTYDMYIDWIYQGLEEYGYITGRSIAIKIVSLFLLVALVRTKEDYVIYALLTSLALGGNYIFNVIHRCTNQSTSQPIGTPTLRSASGQGERPRRKPRAPDAPKIKHDKMKQFYMIDIERKRW